MYKIVIVDDENFNCDIIIDIIKERTKDFEVVKAFDVSYEALDYIKENYVNVVMTDIKMPGMSGLELIDRVRKINPDIQFIVFSGFMDFGYVHKALKYHVENYIFKPLDIDELMETLHNIKEKLDQKYELIYSMEKKADITEKFFLNLITPDMFSEENEVKKAFTSLELPLDYNNSFGSVFFVRIENFEKHIIKNWKYSEGGLHTALKNIFKIAFGYKYVYLVTNEENMLCFFTFSDKIRCTAEDIVQKFKEILDIDADVVTVLNFNKISEIPNMVTDTENIYKNEELPLEKLKKKIRIPKNNPVFDKIFEYINENYMYDIVRADVANHVFLESTYFSKLFKKNIGVTFYDYLLYVRITKAVELLSVKKNITEVSSLVGYSSFKYFCKKFQQLTSYTPHEYKKKLLENRNDG